eukprot:gnl/TRDRNA2_/TRDRNA2_34822_c0_seq1.p1 gnl/TRDRNA2_/TRDRNA2_34822_c0~~gnl/TRDRNA2_/TRDRNA2_34822_c0_seq1.p1  ORF type:complete len:275 (-),score=39.45 gnl/TRDRNA2_/TRDRNA2_34822_c0_seq1:46-783(-)
MQGAAARCAMHLRPHALFRAYAAAARAQPSCLLRLGTTRPSQAFDGRRWLAAVGSEGSSRPVLVATQKSNVGKLAGAIASQIRSENLTAISAMGPEASYAALKAVVIAASYIEDTHAGKTLAVVPVKETVVQADVESVALKLHLRPWPDIPVPEAPEILVSVDTNPGLMAGLMVKILEATEVATIGGMGAISMSKSLKATLLAQKYMQSSLGKDQVLAVVPRLQKFEQHGEDRVRMLLSCIRVPT